MFRPDKPLGKILSFICDQMMLSLCFLVCTLPVITIGGACISLYEQEFALWENREGSLLKDFVKGIGRNFFKGLILMGFGALMIVVTLGICASLILLGTPVRLTIGVISVIVGGISVWFVGLIARYEQKTGTTFRNAYFMGIRSFPVTVALGLVNLLYPALFLLLAEEMLNWYLFFLMFFFPGIAACLSTGLLLRVLKDSRKVRPEEE